MTSLRSKAVGLVLATAVATSVLTGCVHHRYVQMACASELTEVALKPSGSSGGSHSSGASHSSSSSKASSPKVLSPKTQNKVNTSPHAEAIKNQVSAPRSQSKVTPPGEKAYKPPRADVEPSRKQTQAAQRSAPASISRSGSYRSPVTHHVYVWHDPSWYISPSYTLDLFDPYNQWNYVNPLSPFNGRPYQLVDAC